MRGGPVIKKKITILSITAVCVIVLDQITKAVIIDRFAIGASITAIAGFFDVVHFRNPGAAFSIFSSGGAGRTIFLIGTTVIALAIIFIMIRQASDSLSAFSLSLIAGGAIGNLIDRLRFGEVVDFLYFHIGRHYWPAFNVADSAITVGVLLTLYSFYFQRPKGTKK